MFLLSVAPRWAAVDFVLDTGAAVTSLQPGDATAALGIDRDKLTNPDVWPQRVTAHGFGGPSTCYVENAEFGFRHENGGLQVLRDRILIAQPTTANRELPSVLGWNVLRYFRIELDWARRQVRLD